MIEVNPSVITQKVEVRRISSSTPVSPFSKKGLHDMPIDVDCGVKTRSIHPIETYLEFYSGFKSLLQSAFLLQDGLPLVDSFCNKTYCNNVSKYGTN